MGTSASSHETIFSANKCTCCATSYWVVFEKDFFAKGFCRYAFKGTYRGGGKHTGQKCVTKVFIQKVARHYIDWVPDLCASEKANELAREFNKKYPTNRPIHFITPLIAKMDKLGQTGGFLWFSDEDKRYVNKEHYVAIEPFIYGEYKKFNTNNGKVYGISEAIPAFSHFTYVASDKELVVCDIQGVRNDNSYCLTDPAICSRDQIYGPTDLGASGITTFFSTHRCTEICRYMERPVIDTGTKVPPLQPKKGSSYTFELNPKQRDVNLAFKNRKDLPAIEE